MENQEGYKEEKMGRLSFQINLLNLQRFLTWSVPFEFVRKCDGC